MVAVNTKFMKALLLAILVLSTRGVLRAEELVARTFLCTRSPETGWLLSLRRAEDPSRVEFIRPGQTLGPVKLSVRTPGAPWRDVSQGDSGVELRSRFLPRGETLRWEITVKNTGSSEALDRRQRIPL